jgi:hypothetical protein
MEKYKNVIIVNAILFLVFGVLSSGFGLAGVGAIGVLQGCFNLFIAGIVALAGNRKKQLHGYLLCSGVLLLIGFSLCSAFPLNFH